MLLTNSIEKKLLVHHAQGLRPMFQLASPVASDRFDLLAETNFSLPRNQNFGTGNAKKYYFLSKYQFTFFMNKIIHSPLTLYIENTWHHCYNYRNSSTMKTKVFASVRNSQFHFVKNLKLTFNWFPLGLQCL